jgi:sulfide:quinone oxidoreductase
MRVPAVRSRIVIIGGGSAGISVAARLCRQLRQPDVVVVEPSPVHYYQPLWTLAGAGVVRKESTAKPERSVIPGRAKWIQDLAVAIDPERCTVTTASCGTIGYDYLVVAPGIQLDWDRIAGLQGNVGADGVCSVYAYEALDATWRALRSFQGGTALFTMPDTVIKCGGAPQKVMYLAEDYFRRHGVRERTRVIFASAGSRIFGIEKYRPVFERIVQERGIETLFHHTLTALRPERREAVFHRRDTNDEVVIRYDLIHVVPPMSAPDFLKGGPLADERG